MLLLAMAMMSFSQLSAQESAVDDHGIFNHLSVGVGVGLTGISIEAAAPITPYVTVRGGVNIFPQIKVKTDLDLDGEIPASYNGPRSFEVEGKSSLTTGHLLFDVYPFKTSAFHVTISTDSTPLSPTARRLVLTWATTCLPPTSVVT